ncbi:citrate lyase holo-[acyl-carrier protein] synthase [Paenibacillus woosongensis]|uniref:citrate lyase holo-[acyl-carrier protein] synthase n=1 Tax=Paenibacillus woosongensis TaxID=307580 RepID=A0AA95I618_9BACL|nr:citrate lyase holo-[acyl-carrier protein] synthase [Paenibacillus woosongensis]WHX48532.1 citrate lyase holo-[acyl-carrier protein] synthase [Paenibacillus woosongensis]
MKQILEQREKLQALRSSLRDDSALIQFTVNMPGANKTIYPSYELASLGINTIIKDLYIYNIEIKNMMFHNSTLGMIGLFKINEDPYLLKRLCIEIECENILSKYWDIDVFNESGRKISRKMLQLSPRKCFICEKTAKECAFIQAHPIEKLLQQVVLDFQHFKCMNEDCYSLLSNPILCNGGYENEKYITNR